MNDAFTTPAPEETDAQRLARLRARAELQASQEFDEDAVFAKLLAEARDKRMKVISGDEVDLPTDTRGFPEDYDKIKIFRGQNKQDLNYVPLSLNGLVIKVPRDEEVIVPHAFVVDCLDLMVEDITVQSQGGYVTRPAHRAPYNFIGKATTAEYKAFQAQQKDKAQRETARAA
jgi:hypothetical protein